MAYRRKVQCRKCLYVQRAVCGSGFVRAWTYDVWNAIQSCNACHVKGSIANRTFRRTGLKRGHHARVLSSGQQMYPSTTMASTTPYYNNTTVVASTAPVTPVVPVPTSPLLTVRDILDRTRPGDAEHERLASLVARNEISLITPWRET